MNSTERNKLYWQLLKANPEKLKKKKAENLEFYYKNRDVILERMRKKYHEKKDRDMFEILDEKKL